MQVRPVRNRKELEAFVRLPWRIYSRDSLWVPPLRSAVRKTLDPKRNPFFRHADATWYLAWRGGELVGRIGAIVDRLHLERQRPTCGFFGFLEAVDDREVFAALLETAGEDLRRQGMTEMWGPMNPSINSECGVLLEGFEDPPRVLMPWNHPYYPRHLEALGLEKLKDLLAFQTRPSEVKDGQRRSERLMRLARGIRERHPEVKIRPLDMRNYERETKKLSDIFNRVREGNWAFVPVTEEEFAETSREMKMIIDPEMVPVAEVDGEIVGCLLALPDVNAILKRIDGSLLPFGWITFLRMRRRIDRVRTFGAAALPEYRHLGITVLLFAWQIAAAEAGGYDGASELGWVAEDNLKSMKTIENAIGTKPSKRYRVYSSEL